MLLLPALRQSVPFNLLIGVQQVLKYAFDRALESGYKVFVLPVCENFNCIFRLA